MLKKLSFLMVFCILLSGCAQGVQPEILPFLTDKYEYSAEELENMPVKPRNIEERFFIFRIWNFLERDIETFKKIVDTVVEDGFNAIKVHIPWYRVETVPGVYDYSVFDEMIDYVVKEKGLKVAISLDMTRRLGDGIISEEDIMRDKDGNLCMGIADSELPDRVEISFNSENAVSKCVEYYKNIVSHYNELYGDEILFYLPAFSQYAETEYWCTSEYDFSENSVLAFRDYLKSIYGDIEALNKAVSSNFTSFEEIDPVTFSRSHTEAKFWYVPRQLWYSFCHNSLKSVIDKLAEAHDEVAPNTKIAIQLGCVYDYSIRGTFGVKELAENIDVVWVDDGPTMDHRFSMDYLRSVLPENIELAQEIDGAHQVGASPENYLNQGLICFERGCTYVSAANWASNGYLLDEYEGYRHVWREISSTWLSDNAPDIIQPYGDSPSINVSLLDLFKEGSPNEYIAEYTEKSDEECFVYINVTDDLTEINNE